MAEYKRTNSNVIIHVPTGKRIRPSKTVDWRNFLRWKAAGNTPDPADPTPSKPDNLLEMRDLLDDAGQALYDATDLLEAKAAILDLFKALLGRHPNQQTTMQVRPKS